MGEAMRAPKVIRLWGNVLGIGIALTLVGCDFPGQPDIANRPIAPNEVHDFEVLYQRSCAGCHGRDGKLGPAPPLNDPLFLAIIPDEVLQQTVLDGRHGTSMPSFDERRGGTLTTEQADIVAAGVKSKWQSPMPISSELPPYVGSPGNAEQGEAVFERACATCHGKQGQGTEMTGAINDVAFLSLVSDQALRRIIITGRPDLGMPHFADPKGRNEAFQPLTSTDIDNLVALLAHWRNATH